MQKTIPHESYPDASGPCYYPTDMQSGNKRLSDEDFASLYSKVPRLAVDLFITSEKGILLSQRAIEPYIGHWHLPGGTLYKGESIHDAAVRIAKLEAGIDIRIIDSRGYLEFPKEKRGEITIHTVSLIIHGETTGGSLIKDKDALDIGYFIDLPSPIVPEHERVLKTFRNGRR